MPVELDSIEAAIAAIAEGQLVIVVDDVDRENEGDLIMAAAKAAPEQVAFMIRHTSGILCAPLPHEEARRLRLDPMVALNDAPMQTAFTVSVDYRFGLTTGIAADERSNTVRALANANASADDFVRPGHVFPLIGKAGGVLVRSGHTEAAIDLARLARLPPVGVLAELVNDDGTVKRMPQLCAFAAEHRLKMISVADLIGALGDGADVPVRIHREQVISDVFARRDGPDANLIPKALERLRAKGRGVLIYLREGAAGVAAGPLEHEAGGAAAAEASAGGSEQVRSEQWRDVGIGAQILRDLGVVSIRLQATRHRHYVGLAGFGIDITATELIDL